MTDQEVQEKKVLRSIVPTLITVIVHGCILLVLCLFFLLFSPKAEAVYVDWNIALFQPTHIAIDWSRFVRASSLLAIFLLVSILVVDGIVYHLLRTRAKTETASVVWSGFITLLFVLGVSFVLFVHLFQLLASAPNLRGMVL